jgi:hypothetical protein
MPPTASGELVQGRTIGAAGGRILVQVPGPLRSTPARPAGVFGQRREQPQLVLVGAGEVLLADVAGVGATIISGSNAARP